MHLWLEVKSDKRFFCFINAHTLAGGTEISGTSYMYIFVEASVFNKMVENEAS